MSRREGLVTVPPTTDALGTGDEITDTSTISASATNTPTTRPSNEGKDKGAESSATDVPKTVLYFGLFPLSGSINGAGMVQDTDKVETAPSLESDPHLVLPEHTSPTQLLRWKGAEVRVATTEGSHA